MQEESEKLNGYEPPKNIFIDECGYDIVEEYFFSVSLPAYNFHLEQREDESDEDFRKRLQEELDFKKIPVKIRKK